MKALILTIVSVLSVSAFANIENSKFEKRHQDLIKKSIIENCSMRRASFVELSNKTKTIRVDQGIIDYEYETVLEVTDRVDQGVSDLYTVTVKSSYSDMYDHSSQNWGAYSVESVNCIIK